MPEALAKIPGWLIALAFTMGGLTYILVEFVVEGLQPANVGQGSRTGVWMIYMAVSLDLFTDGVLIGTGSVVSFSMAVVLALGQVLADVPEGYATIANMKGRGIPRSRRIALAALLFVPVLSAAILSYYLLRNQSEAWQFAFLVLAAGLLTVAAVEDMLSEAHDTSDDTRWSVLAFTVGFAVFVLVATGLKG